MLNDTKVCSIFRAHRQGLPVSILQERTSLNHTNVHSYLVVHLSSFFLSKASERLSSALSNSCNIQCSRSYCLPMFLKIPVCHFVVNRCLDYKFTFPANQGSVESGTALFFSSFAKNLYLNCIFLCKASHLVAFRRKKLLRESGMQHLALVHLDFMSLCDCFLV